MAIEEILTPLDRAIYADEVFLEALLKACNLVIRKRFVTGTRHCDLKRGIVLATRIGPNRRSTPFPIFLTEIDPESELAFGYLFAIHHDPESG